MAATGRTTRSALAESLQENAYRFEFFQAVRVLEALSLEAGSLEADSPVAISTEEGDQRTSPTTSPVGYDAVPSDELVRFRALASQTFAQSDVHSYRETVPGQNQEQDLPPNLNVSFLGLFGPKGALPGHFTRTVIQRNDDKDFVLRDFLDLFNHRAISLFYRAWEKYRLPAAFERSQRSTSQRRPSTDLFTQCMLSLIGFGTPELTARQEIDDRAFLYYAGHFSRSIPSALALQQICSDYFSFEVQIQQLQGEWLALSLGNQSSLTIGRQSNNRIGMDVIAGESVWTVECKFRLRIGPVTYEQFQRLMPGGKDLDRLAQMVRSFVGPVLAFDIQPVLLASETPTCELGSCAAENSGEPGQQLGYNSWLFSKPPTEDATDAVFAHSGSPTRG